MGYIRADWSLFLPALLKSRLPCIVPWVCLGLAILHASKGGWLAGRGETRTIYVFFVQHDRSERETVEFRR